jgi:hypothetical protein
MIAFGEAREKASFLFGRDVEQYLARLERSMYRVEDAEKIFDGPNFTAHERERAAESRRADWEVVKGFYEVFPQLLDDYARMDHKRPFTRMRKLWRR